MTKMCDFLSLSLLVFILQTITAQSCPSSCECKNNNTWIKCGDNLLEIPTISVSVQYLDLSNNYLGPITTSFSQFSSLVHLDISANHIFNISHNSFRGLTDLESLNLSNNNIRHLPHNLFCDNSNIKSLDVSNNLFSVLPDRVFKSLEPLIYFSIRGNKLTSLDLGPHWQMLRNIEKLDFSFNKLKNLSADTFSISNMWKPNVRRTLNLRGCELTEIANDTLGQFKGLYEVKLANNPGLKEERLRTILLDLQKTNLKRIDFSEMALTDVSKLLDGVQGLSLEYLSLLGNSISEIPPGSLSNIRSLKYLNLKNNQLASNIIGLKDLCNLKYLDLSFNSLTKLPISITSLLVKLTFLDVSHNKFQLSSDIDLTPLTLQTFNISHNKLDNLVLPGNTTHLENMIISNNNINNISSIQNVQKLKYFDISHNILHELPPYLFTRALEFHMANFSNNRIEILDQRCFLPSSPDIVDLSNNLLTEVMFGSWSEISEMFLHHNLIESIRYHAFYRMNHLTTLDLSHNKLQKIPSLAFKYLTELVNLNLGHNDLNLKAYDLLDLFVPLVSLRGLDLGYNQLSEINETSFQKCPELKSLSLNNNKFSLFPVFLFLNLKNMKYFDASNNPFVCNCDLLPFRNWMIENYKTFPNKSYTCVEPPNQQDIAIFDYEPGQFECNKSFLYMIILGSLAGIVMFCGLSLSLWCHYHQRCKEKLFSLLKLKHKSEKPTSKNTVYNRYQKTPKNKKLNLDNKKIKHGRKVYKNSDVLRYVRSNPLPNYRAKKFGCSSLQNYVVENQRHFKNSSDRRLSEKQSSVKPRVMFQDLQYKQHPCYHVKQGDIYELQKQSRQTDLMTNWV